VLEPDIKNALFYVYVLRSETDAGFYIGEDALGRERYLKSGSESRFLKSQLSSYLKKNSAQITA
jgi:hypothetical protein